MAPRCHLSCDGLPPASHVPVLYGVEGLLVGDVIHKDEAHGSSVVSCGDGAVTLLARRVLEKTEAAV